MKRSMQVLLAATTILAVPAGASAQTASTTPASPAAPAAPPKIAQGETVYDQAGGVVGTIKEVDAQFATLATAKSTVKLPLSSFGAGDKGPLLGMTAAQVDAAAGAAAPPPTQTAATPPKIEVGAAVNDMAGKPVGKIESVDGRFATLATAKNKVRLPLTAFASGDAGPVIAMTAEQLDAAAAGAQPTGKN